ncbi:MAG: cobalt-zinc-cadmium efflux system membrane fusion protein [Afipia broomeae]|jgi:cobalt-zinc-cadmium efflux system membrane fusion protein|uniref:HlyD family efflux transporter periplasmic adaptor subunit n=1 Tax=Candidatus Afipia apatlaquensis TaxID=2712852 RepID=A0A7C9RDH5_9BRAD|nr:MULTISPECIES: efflux RND transporter periplasmic adaptor subunit [Nitrobacteraceae]MBQ8101683.1 efflux RND transporter periplasmic adaptor subunit [Afipia sp.]NGX94644.1 HlyD family efflux transporter periplasmic adaptor subunit [Candidatus Afipia apatlaquensis]RTL76560.1 MAG: HlyD family efflux transporter periplasmic adaptor subunit [Bradyrhizobiaceae bacterium]TXH80121.1 MAG: HlyD family efflux transporter periplasmic adaptor subunit [Rhizobium sp.]MCF2523247.1 efflux RND transporter per
MKISRTMLIIGALIAVGAGVYAFAPSKSAAPATKEAAAGKEEGHGAEGVEMSDAKVAAAGIEVVAASKGTLRDALQLNGILQPNQEALVQVTPRFPGVVREIKKRIGDQVEKGELLAKIESNQSLTVYEMRAPIAGTVIDRQISLGEYASEQKPAFTVADISTVWVDLSVYRRDLPRVKLGDTVLIDIGDGGKPIEAKLSYISPIGSSDTQSALARAVVSNDDLRLRAGLFVSAQLILTAKEVPVVVKSEALQTVENRNVVFVRNGNKFEVRDVELGSRDPEQVEVVFGLLEGDKYAAKNSFVVKAELAKGSASHEH